MGTVWTILHKSVYHGVILLYAWKSSVIKCILNNNIFNWIPPCIGFSSGVHACLYCYSEADIMPGKDVINY